MEDNKSAIAGVHVNKSGRKGDPRMHRAVAARLSNPSLSLFEALRAGGFDYSMDDDSQALDADQVTLGQRKNQLSRRIRMARREASGGDSVSTGERKRSSQDLLDDFDEGGNNSGDDTLMARVVKAKNHPDYRGPIIVLPARRHNGRPASHSLDETAVVLGHDSGALGLCGVAPAPPAHHNGFATSTGYVPVGGVASGGGYPSSLPSGVAVASLNSTAQKIGMTLEQLALSLSQCSNLARVLTSFSSDPNDCEDRRERLARNLCMTEVRSLYSRCMLLAGFSLEQASDDSPKCIEFAVKAWQQEGQRLEELVRSKNISISPFDNLSSLSGREEEEMYGTKLRADSERKCDHGETTRQSGEGRQQQQQQQQQQHGAHDACSSHTHSDHLHDRSFSGEDGRHTHSHRLQGCGHKAILHQPADGPAHIDFVVGDKIECYQGLRPPMGPAEHTNLMNIWPSQYTCDAVSCENPGCAANGASNQHQGEEAPNALPRILDISSLDLDGKEWISAVDDTLLSLFKLSDSSPSDDKTSD
jgi:hypothetical protein